MCDGEGEGEGENGDGYPRGKQFLLIQRSHPHGGASLVDPLLDLSPSRSVSLPSFLSQSHVMLLSFTLSLSLSFSIISLSLFPSWLLFLFSSFSFLPSLSLSLRARTWLLRTSAPSLATLDSHLSYSLLHPLSLRRIERYGSFKIRQSIHYLVFRIDCP